MNKETKLASAALGATITNMFLKIFKMALVFMVMTWLVQLALAHVIPVYWPSFSLSLEFWDLFWVVFAVRQFRILFFRSWDIG